MRRTLVMAAGLLLFSAPAWACGAYLSEDATANVRNGGLRVLLVPDTAGTTVVIQAAYAGSAEDFVWLIPVPAPLDGIPVEVDSAAFDPLLRQTAPRYSFESPLACGSGLSLGIYGCGGTFDDSGDVSDVTAITSFDTGVFKVDVLDAAAEADLAAWLTAAGYAVNADLEPLLDAYVADGFHFMAVRVSDAPRAEDAPLGLPALAYRYASDLTVVPLRLARTSTVQEFEAVVMLAGPHRVEPGGDVPWTTAELGAPLFGTGWGDDFDTYYTGRLRVALDEAGAGSWGLEFAGWVDSLDLRADGDELDLFDSLAAHGLLPSGRPAFVSRYRSFLRPEWMRADLRLVPAEDDAMFSVRPSRGGPVPQGALVLPLIVMGAGLGLRRRRV